MNRILPILRAMRPHQWIKNLFVFAPVVFAKELFVATVLEKACAAVVGFCCAASAIYLINDLVDRESDRQHPLKRQRAIASGDVSTRTALLTVGMLLVAAVLIAAFLGGRYAVWMMAYFVLNLGYSFGLKKIAYVDALCIALGFELRVLAGSAAVGVPASAYLCVVTFLLALFLAFGKRAHELAQGQQAFAQRSSLRFYTPRIVTTLLYVTGFSTVAVYAVYTLDPAIQAMLGTSHLVFTVIFVAFGMLRFVVLMRNSNSSESPTEAMLKDWPFLINLVLWAVVIVTLVYLGNAAGSSTPLT